MVLSDRAIRRLVEAGRIGIEPFDPKLIQPSSLDVRVDRLFRVFRNSRYPYIDVKTEQDELTELVEVADDEPFILHPGEFVLGSTLERVTLPDDLVARLEGKSSTGPARAADPLDRRLHRPGLRRARHARALERREPADHDLSGDEDRPALVRPDVRTCGDAVRHRLARLEVPGSTGADAEPLLAELRGRVVILVTGASGFVGRHVTRDLVANGARVRALVRSARGASALAGNRLRARPR